jgi:hypothetical protein
MVMSYVTQGAISRANAVGLNLSLADWRGIFLAITDEIASDPPAAQNVSASFIGNVRDGGERWRINIPGREFDVIYEPASARIVLVIRPRDPDAQPAVLPKPTPPLKGKAAEAMVLSDG